MALHTLGGQLRKTVVITTQCCYYTDRKRGVPPKPAFGSTQGATSSQRVVHRQSRPAFSLTQTRTTTSGTHRFPALLSARNVGTHFCFGKNKSPMAAEQLPPLPPSLLPESMHDEAARGAVKEGETNEGNRRGGEGGRGMPNDTSTYHRIFRAKNSPHPPPPAAPIKTTATGLSPTRRDSLLCTETPATTMPPCNVTTIAPASFQEDVGTTRPPTALGKRVRLDHQLDDEPIELDAASAKRMKQTTVMPGTVAAKPKVRIVCL